MAGPIVKGDLDVSEGVINSIRHNGDLTSVAAAGTEAVKAGEVILVTGTAALTRTLPAANATGMKNGWTIRYINDSTGTLTINDNGGSAVGTLGTGLSADVVLKTRADADGTWELIQLDQDNTGVSKDTTTFTASSGTGSWSAASGGEYTFTVTAASHGAGTSPTAHVQEGSTTFEDVVIEVNVNATGDVAIKVNETPDGRFAGRIIIF